MKLGSDVNIIKTPVPLEAEILCQNTEDPMDFWIWLNRRIQQYANLEITGNEIKNAPGAGILLNYCDGAKVSGNTIENVLLSKEVPGRDKGFKDPTPVWIQNSVNIEVQK